MTPSKKELQGQFTQYYHEYKHKVYSYILYRINGDHHVAEDITSDVFVKAYRSFETYNDTSAFSTWVFTIARNTLIDHFRKTKTKIIEYDENIHDEGVAETFVDQIDVDAEIKDVQAALSQLPGVQQDVIILKYIQGWSAKEIAQQIHKTPENVRKILSRGLKSLRAKLIALILFISLW